LQKIVLFYFLIDLFPAKAYFIMKMEPRSLKKLLAFESLWQIIFLFAVILV